LERRRKVYSNDPVVNAVIHAERLARQPSAESAPKSNDRKPALARWHRRVYLSLPNFLRVWDLLQYLVPHKVRWEVFTPCREELERDYLTAMRKYRSPLARKWLQFCFLIRTLLMIVGCYKANQLDKLSRFSLARCAAGGRVEAQQHY
jgi:hypothetical protein